MEEKLIIQKKDKLKGDDGYKVFSVRIKEEFGANFRGLQPFAQRNYQHVFGICD